MAGVISASTLIGAGASVLGAGTSAMGSIKGGQAAAGQAREQGRMNAYQAQVARNNAIIAEQNAQRAEVVAAASAEAKSLEGAARLGAVKVGQAASGVDVNTGSALDVQVGQRMLNKLDTETVFSNELLKAYGYRTQAANATAEADLLRYRAAGAGKRASDAETAGYLKAAGTLLSSASSLPFGKMGDFFSGGTGGGATGDYLGYGGVAGPAF